MTQELFILAVLFALYLVPVVAARQAGAATDLWIASGAPGVERAEALRRRLDLVGAMWLVILVGVLILAWSEEGFWFGAGIVLLWIAYSNLIEKGLEAFVEPQTILALAKIGQFTVPAGGLLFFAWAFG